MLTNCDFSIILLLTNHIQMNTWNRVEKIYILKKKCIAIFFFSLSLCSPRVAANYFSSPLSPG